MNQEIKVINVCESKTKDEFMYRINKIIAKLICKLGSTEEYKITLRKNT